MENKEYWNAINDIAQLTDEGFFGEEINKLVKRKTSMDIAQYLVESLEIWINDKNQYGKQAVKKIILIFFELYSDAINVGGQKTFDILTAFFKGYSGNPETEGTSSYTEFIRSNIETRNLIRQYSGKKLTISERKKFADSFIQTYSKGVELINKMMTTWILLFKIKNNEDILPMDIYTKFLGEKSKLFKKYSKGKFVILIDSIDRNIRNAEAHIDIRYDTNKDIFQIKVKEFGKKSINIKNISAKEMILEIFPKVGWIVQGFIFSCTLMVLMGTAPDKYTEIMDKINNI
ncbi:MAG: hypothetical protein MUO82_02450 [Candidatus Thermoplasmatota archaeon]|nr:hypothetical protein [Candidatus Thermoplasmatota archaeon]